MKQGYALTSSKTNMSKSQTNGHIYPKKVKKLFQADRNSFFTPSARRIPYPFKFLFLTSSMDSLPVRCSTMISTISK